MVVIVTHSRNRQSCSSELQFPTTEKFQFFMSFKWVAVELFTDWNDSQILRTYRCTKIEDFA
jgi:hypothetical protein